MTHLDLFSGIGGFTVAAERVGIATIGFSEIDPYACKILKRRWPHVPNFGDIRNVRDIRADLVTGGFPCQPFSCAGKRRGTADDRHIWPEMLRVIDEARPAWVLGENVPGIIGMELDRVLSDLEIIGYACWPCTVPAVAVDARHRRDRVWIVAYANQSGPQGRNGEELPECKAERITGQGCSLVGHTEGQRRIQGHSHSGRNGQRTGSPEEWAGIGGPSRWKPEPAICRVAHGVPHRSHRLKGLGNAIVPQVAEIFLRGMVIEFQKARV